MDNSNPLAVCGSVLHHCVLYVKDGDQVRACVVVVLAVAAVRPFVGRLHGKRHQEAQRVYARLRAVYRPLALSVVPLTR